MTKPRPQHWGPCFLDGVEFTFKAREVKAFDLPVGTLLDYYPSILLEELDFSCEVEVLKKYKQKIEKKKNKATKDAKCSNSESAPDSSNGYARKLESSKKKSVPIDDNHTLPSSFSSEPLIPTKAKNNSKNSSNNHSSAFTNDPKFLQDFEQASDPFDSVELKTINDIEELRNVLHSTNLPANYSKTFVKDNSVPNISDIKFPK